MERVEKTVFISYRRTNVPWALAIFQNLTQFGYDVFFDFSGVNSGDFETVILENIRARAHFLVILTPSALEKCGESGDWLRREIETAFESRRNIVPLMLEGFDFGTPTIASQLTGTLAPLKHYNALNVPADYFLAAMERLRDRFLNVALDAVPQPASLPARQAAAEQKKEAAAAPQVAEEELTAQQWFERGFNAVDLDEQLRFYSNAIRLKPDYSDAFNNRGLAWRKTGDFGNAIADYNEAIRLKPDSALAFNNRGYARHLNGDPAGALTDFNEAIRLMPDYAMAFNNRGNSRSEKTDLDGAIADYNEAIRLSPDYADPFNNRGIARDEKGDLDGAITDYSEAIRLKPDYADAFYNRGIARDKKGDLDGAIADYSEAIRLKPDYAEAFNNRGAARYRKSDFDGAIADYNEAIRLKPDFAKAIANRERLLKIMSDVAKNQHPDDHL
jgi:tetratricopeptide (TPR) repeat protein